MRPIALVRTPVFVPLFEFLDRERVPYEGFLEAVKLSPQLFERPNDFIPLAQACAFADRVAQGAGPEDIGILVGKTAKIPEFGLFSELIGEAPRLVDALDIIIGGVTAFSTAERFSLEWRGPRLFFCHRFDTEAVAGRCHVDDFSLGVMINVIKLALGSNWKPEIILLPVKERTRKRRYEALFDTQAEFENDTCAVSVPHSLLASPIRERASRASLANGQPASPIPPHDLVGSIREVIRSRIRYDYPNIDHVAKLAGVSVSTLQRRLREEGIVYSKLVDQVRRDLALELFAKDITIADIASELGYSAPENFTRAFRTWAGLTPSTFRTHHRDPQPARGLLEKNRSDPGSL